MKNSILLCVLTLLFFTGIFSGCATTMSYEDIVRTAKATQISDGVDRKEAIVLAQNYLIENDLDGHHSVFRVGEVLKDEDYWIVKFNAGVARGAAPVMKYGFVEPISVKINAKTGRGHL